ncbi:putative 60S ribosomal protein L6-like [Capsicum annuum]|nr:putative 60S ribosomal protein L6-like [Capsicum annuum]KAF3664412.1 putative 60S ribosomal protein L6-like [Capsicum annuum]
MSNIVYNHSSTTNKRQLDQVPSSSFHIRKRKGNPSRFIPTSPTQFFVRSFATGKTLVIRADSTDSVEMVRNKIMLIAGIPANEQRLVYKGKLLGLEQTLEFYGIEQDATVHLLGLMQTTYLRRAWKIIHDLISTVSDILESSVCFPSESDRIIMLLVQFTTMTPEDYIEEACEHMELFISSSALAALVMLYMSPDNAKKFIAEESICAFVNSFTVLPMLPAPVYNVCVPVVSEFCKLLKGAAGLDDQLYKFCRIRLGAIVGSIGIASLEDQALFPSQTPIQFLVHLFPRADSLVIQADSMDPVEFIHYRIMLITGIPPAEQRLIYKGKQIHSEQTLSDCGIQMGESVQLVGQMRNTDNPQSWKLIDDLVSLVSDLLKDNDPSTLSDAHHIIMILKQFLRMTPNDNIEKASQHLQIFNSSSAPAFLVMLYLSPEKTFKFAAHYSIRTFINSLKSELPKHTYSECVRMVLEFCKLLREAVGHDDCLYSFCRSSISAIVEAIEITRCNTAKGLSALNDVFLFVFEVVVAEVSHDLELSMGFIESTGFSMSIVRDFTDYMCSLRKLFPLKMNGTGEHIECLHRILYDLYCILHELLDKMESCLMELEDHLGLQDKRESKPIVSWWSQYLVILKELNSISELLNCSEVFWQNMRQRKVSLCFLIVTFAKSSVDCQWVLEHKEVTDFEVRKHFTTMMLQEVTDGNEASLEMLIDRSKLMEESFEYIGDEDPELLRGDLLMVFEHEEATGPGVLREWFYLVCREIFNLQKALFVACPNDRRRFFPNAASKVDPMHLEYFSFAGRMIALALMHKIQIGVVFDRVFFLQLAGEEISLEDIRDADPILYNSCKQILDMDPETVDQDTLSLTFVCDEVEELGSNNVVELCPNGKDTVVTSKNRKEYVNLLIQYRLVTSIAQQTAHFSKGFADITTLSTKISLFRSLDLEDLDQMLDGSGSAISVEDWKAHTDYNGYEESDPQISWFWEIVGSMSAKKKKMLLFFWTSIKYLPLDGFGGLDSRLSIYRTSESCSHLPSARTCFYRICFPPYISKDVMLDRLSIITQDHVGCSFGTW